MEEIRRLRREGLSISKICELTGRDRGTVRKYLDPAITKPVYKPRSKRQRKLDPHKRYLEERLTEGVWNAVILLRELRERGYTGGAPVRDGARAAGPSGLGFGGEAGA